MSQAIQIIHESAVVLKLVFEGLSIIVIACVLGFAESKVNLAVLVYLMMVVPLNLVFTVYHAIRERLAQAQA